MNETENSIEDENSSKEVCLPEGDYVLECWKVRDGAFVMKGETIAMAILKSKADNTSVGVAAAPQPPKASHKRPSRRKINRPAPASHMNSKSLAGTKKGEELSTIKLPPTVKDTQETSSEKADEESESKPEATKESKPKQDPSSIPVEAPISGILRIRDQTNGSLNSNVIGHIEPCDHPAKVHGLCAVCGLPMPKKDSEDPEIGMPTETSKREGLQVTENGITIEVSKKEGFKMGKENTERLRRMKKLSLVLDLDATLVHATGDPRAHKHLDRDDVRQIFVPGSEDGRGGHFRIPHYVKLRPHVKKFLEGVLPGYELGVYTAGTREYAEQIAIILCRDLVGATKDQFHLDQLRYQIAQAERQLAALRAAPHNEARENETNAEVRGQNSETTSVADQYQKDEAKEGDANADAELQEQDSEAISAADQDQKDSSTSEVEPPKKRRRVTFAVETQDAQEERSPDRLQITAEDVLALEQELGEAEEKEKEALELRQRLFGKRIVSRTDITDLGRDVKSLRRIFPCGGTMAAVVDDREEVWANAKDNIGHTGNVRRGEPPENLLLVEAYHWQPFRGFAEINNPSGINLSADSNLKSGDEGDEQLLWTKDILVKLHERFYKQEPINGPFKTVPEVLSEMRKEVLAGEKIALSGLVPLLPPEELNDTRRPRQDYIRYVETMGATVVPTVQPDTTFVVAKSDNGSDKILMGWKTPGCLVVKRSWLMQCYWSLSRRDPKTHELPPSDKSIAAARALRVSHKPAEAQHTSIFSVNQDEESSDEDEDFAADLEKDLM